MDFLLSDILDQHARWMPDDLAIGQGSTSFTWQQLNQRVTTLASALGGRGIAPGDRVAVLSDHAIDLVVLQYALARMGGVLVPINNRLTSDDIAFILDDSDPSLFLSTSPYRETADAALRSRSGGTVTTKSSPAAERSDADGLWGWVDDRLAEVGTGSAVIAERPSWDDTLAILYTGGTTGRSKGAEISHRRQVLDALSVAATFGYRRSDRFLMQQPLSHTSGWDYIKTTFIVGGSVVIVERFDPDVVLHEIERWRCTAMWAVPLVLRRLLDSPSFTTTDLSSMRLIAYSPFDPTDVILAAGRRDRRHLRVPTSGESRDERDADQDDQRDARVGRRGPDPSGRRCAVRRGRDIRTCGPRGGRVPRCRPERDGDDGRRWQLVRGLRRRRLPAIASGEVRVALMTYAETPRTNLIVPPMVGTGRGLPSSADNAEAPFGMNIVANYALVAARHRHQYGTTSAQLAEIAVTSRAHAQLNPPAVQGLVDMGIKHTGEITVDDVLSSRVIADPLHVLDCCLVSDGGGAIVIVAAELAHDRPSPPVWILSASMAAEYQSAERDITVSAAARSGPRAFARAGITPADVDVAMLYDSFTIRVLVVLEDLGFCARGEGGAYVEGGRRRYDVPGGPALNTDGGGLSSCHPGMRGLFLLIEATHQLRGRSTAQVEGAQVAVAHGNGVLLASRHVGATVVLGGETR